MTDSTAGEPGHALTVLKKLSCASGAADDTLACSFCGRRGAQVRVLIGGRNGTICDACVEVCRGLIATERGVEGA